MPAGRPLNSFISQIFLSSPPSPERFVLNREPYEKFIAETMVVEESVGKKKYKKGKQLAAQPAKAENTNEAEETVAAASG